MTRGTRHFRFGRHFWGILYFDGRRKVHHYYQGQVNLAEFETGRKDYGPPLSIVLVRTVNSRLTRGLILNEVRSSRWPVVSKNILVSEVARWKMASSEDGDLIDLGNEDLCVPRVPFTETLPEQEHLLDVCPPKLEETLSLTRKQEQMQNVNDSSDVLVTLGHDQVMPIRKRIDVVSSDTIKRVRDITRNLEPVIRKTRPETNKEPHDTVDHGNATTRNLKNDDCPSSDRATGRTTDNASDKASRGHQEDETFEAQEISNAFDFLAEHEDVELDQLDELDPEYDRCDTLEDPPLLTGLSARSGPENEDLLSCHRASSSTTFNRKPPDKYFLRDNFHVAEKSKPTFELSSGDAALKSASCADSVDREFELKLELELGLETGGGVAIVKKRYQNGSFGRTVGRSCFQRAHRKSWTESGSPKNDSKDAFLRFERSSSLRDCSSEPSSSKAARRQSSFVSRFSVNDELDEEDTNPQDGCSECSEVDWSWLEEVECPRAADPSSTLVAVQENAEHHRGGSASPTRETARRKRGCEHRATDAGCSAAMSVSGTAKCPVVVGDLGWSITSSDQLPTDPAVAEIDHRDEAPRCNASSATSNATSNETVRDSNNPATLVNSWLRASMRRLRHLRLPDGFERQHGGSDSSNRRGFGVNTTASESAIASVVSTATGSAPNSLPDIALIAPEILAAQTNGTSGTLLRPSSAPVRNANSSSAVALRRGGRQLGGSRLQAGRDSREPSSRQSSVLSTTSGTTTCSSSFGDASTNPPSSTVTSPQRVASRRICERQRDVDRDGDRREDEDEDANPLGKWPHSLSPALACLSCTLGLFNISRFSILSIQFGANFIVQFLILSFVLGIPLLTLHVCLGQRLAAGSVDMWKISPLFQGVGIALLTAQAFIGIYSIVGVSWMFVYFRDSFITKQDKYRWAEPFSLYRIDKPVQNASTLYKLYETVPDYFSGVVLQRHHLNESNPGVVTLKFQVAFNLAVVWMIVFVSLSKGLRSYGKVVYVFTLIPVFGILVLGMKLLRLTPPGSIYEMFPTTVGAEFFINGKSWVAASVEVFLTWGLLGAAAMQIAAHNKHKHLLQRDTNLVIMLTIMVLLLAALVANTCVQLLKDHGYVYIPSSFERISSYVFLRPANQPAPPGYSSTPERFMAHASFIVGERVTRPGADFSESGYQALRLSTELVPAMLALLGTEQVSPFWAVLFYFVLILFGIAQQLAIWHCVITGIMAINTKMMKLWETTITFFSCACGYILGLPMATELGIHVVYYLDYTIGGSWWIMILYLVQVGAVFAVRGRPHSGEAVVAELFPPTSRCLKHWAGPLLSFTWNVVLPVIFMVLGITVFKNAGFRELYSYRRTTKDYWSVWSRQLGAAIQLIPILTIPAVAIIQTCRYLNSGPPDIFDRIQLLYRPSLETDDPRDSQTHIGTETSTSIHGNGIVSATTEVPFEDPPPKYTPPPSYTTATGASIAKMLRQSFRRSVRRIVNVLGESSAPRQRPALQPPPPDYATVLVEMNQGRQRQDVTIHVTDGRIENGDGDVDGDGEGDCDGDGDGDGDEGSGGGDDGGCNGRTASVRSNVLDRNTNRPNTIDRAMRIGSRTASAVGYSVERMHSTLERNRTRPSTIGSSSSSNLTAVDVANLLRSSIRRGTARTQQSLRRSFCHDDPTAAASVENLVEAAAPIGEESLVIPKDMSLVSSDQQADVDNNDKKTAVETDNSVSVI
ncbi:sodium-dependent transporter bedraggled isoform X2 [Megalopta genalis]|uniref:sodium-dependent transporter bedraggled isoform X2 n=1 Tax=Megalopta genalis TaxID=115081 RepID=UPI003FD34208